ncbi:MAG: diaminopimelate epimerase [Acetobacteraceae bacterium]|nr:diaminopimelate epimerase [Acetobacteraceae bacterium]
MRVPFVKMHGCGNDFVVLDERAGALGLTPARAAGLADRRRGIGCDQLISVEPPPEGSDVAAFMRIRNSDGAEAGACGNATRCVAALLAPEGGRRLTIRTLAGDLRALVLTPDRVAVDMGEPGLTWRDIPLAEPRDTLRLDIAAGPLAGPAAASMGNPHATFFVEDVAAIPLEALGPALERHPIFPERANIGVAQVLAPDRVRLRVWERGAGLTLACGSGACAALVNAHRRGLAGRAATLVLDGGELLIEWLESGQVRMTGPVATAFTGSVDLDAYPP